MDNLLLFLIESQEDHLPFCLNSSRQVTALRDVASPQFMGPTLK